MTYQPIDINAFLPTTQEQEAPKPAPKSTPPPKKTADPGLDFDLAHIEHLVQELEARRIDITSHHEDWIKAGYSLASLGEYGRDFYHRVCSMYPGYDYDECEKKFTYQIGKFISGRTGLGTFVNYCSSVGLDTSHPWKKRQQAQKGQRITPQNQDQEETELTEEDILAFLNDAEIDFSEELAPPPVCLEVVQGGLSAIIGTRGNFSMVIGKAKSRKTFFITIALAAAINTDPVLGIFRGSLPAEKSNVLYFDTEQGKYHVQKAARRVLRLSGIHTPDNFRAYGLRKYNPAERLQIIDTAINTTPNVGLVVIDGVRDLVSSINDEELATMLSSKLLKWTEEQELHVMCVLHQNKGDNNARGHLGTELQNKAETVLSITKDKENGDMSIVEAEYCREREFEPFAFEINDHGLPVLVDHLELRTSAGGSTAKGVVPIDWPEETHREVLEKAFKDVKFPRYGQLVSQVKLVLNEYGLRLGDNKVKDFIQFYQNQGYISQQGKPRSKDSFWQLDPKTPEVPSVV
ncbi:primase-like protein [Pontibacter ummariensis]|uniref:Primase C terminal 2 (PriCT-2) n=1 Tax=Pontibacter ummariensis TaxID=1610492 RepID=A0A239DCU3_9BACT|nr:AAA family ATPase [Pontibacter ummariensis]PRY14364.1 primase-like protein [Pontibacter ummariensis]SNS30205.1 Primase C terminal 2 (PriCT-2) [Pontibacter ummariensis]